MNEVWQWYGWPPLLAGIGVAALAGPMGSVMIWRRLAYLGDTLSHAALLGITFALAWHWPILGGVTLIAVGVACLLFGLQRFLKGATDTLLGIVSHSTLAFGLLLLATRPMPVDVLGFLYGDILAITWREVGWIYGGGGLIALCLRGLWDPLLRMALHRELAQAEGVWVERVDIAYLLLFALVVALAILVVGVLLVTALLLLPAAVARQWAKTPEEMAWGGSLVGIASVLLGIGISHYWDVPTGPTIVVSATGCLLVSLLGKGLGVFRPG